MARKWRKKPGYGTVVLHDGKHLRAKLDDALIIEGDHYAKDSHCLEEVKEGTPASNRRLLTDSQPARGGVALVEDSSSNDKESAEGEEEKEPVQGKEVGGEAAPEKEPATDVPPPQPEVGTTTANVDGATRTRSRRNQTSGA